MLFQRVAKISTHNYTFRVDITSISVLITTIQNTLQVKPGSVRDITIICHKFNNLPIYETRGKAKQKCIR